MSERGPHNPESADMPEDVDIRCPNCGAEALFSRPFRHSGDELVARFPDVLPPDAGQTPARLGANGSRAGHIDSGWGVANCLHCGCRRKHRLSWPGDAFYAVSFRGVTLWAWNRQHLVALREFIASKERDAPRHRAWGIAQARLPRPFVDAKNRDKAVARIDRVLGRK
jgi:hypothetical protein